jgi:hypothetical protein
MRSGELQYIADSMLLEKVARLRAPIERQAGIFDLMGGALSGVAEQIQRYVIGNTTDVTNMGDLAGRVLNLAVSFLIGRRSLLWGLVYGVASAMGFGIDDIIKKMVQGVKGLLGGGQPVSANQVDAVGTQLISAQGGQQADDMMRDAFAPLYALEKNGQLFRFAASPLDIFHTIGRYRTYSLVVRVIGWILKTFLLSAGLLVGGGMIAHTLGLDKTAPKPAETGGVAGPGAGMAKSPGDIPRPEGMQSQQGEPVSLLMAPAPPGLEPSGRGEEYHANDQYTAWVVPIYGSVPETLLDWAMEIYPQLQGQEQAVTSSPSFNRMANILSSHLDYRTPNYLLMPPGIHRRIDVVNNFIGDAVKRLQQSQQQAAQAP